MAASLTIEPSPGADTFASDAEVAAAIAAERSASRSVTNQNATDATNTFPTRIETKLKQWTQVSPTNAENQTIGYFVRAATITAVRGVIRGSTSVTLAIKQGADRSAGGTDVVASVAVSNTTTGAALTIANASITAGNFVWIVTSALSGTPDEVSVSLEYTGG